MDLGNEFDLSASISNLIRLGLIHHEDNGIVGYSYYSFKEVPIVINNKKKLDSINEFEGNGRTTTIEINKQVIIINDFGNRFAETCL